MWVRAGQAQEKKRRKELPCKGPEVRRNSAALYLTWITNKDLLSSTGSFAQCYEAAWMGGEFGGERIHVNVWLSLFTVHLKLPQHCELALP